MKDKIVSLCCCLCLIYLSSCSGSAGGDSSSVDSDLVISDNSIIQTVNYSGIKDISSTNVRVVEVPLKSGYCSEYVNGTKYVYMVRVNTCPELISYNRVKRVDTVTGLTLSNTYSYTRNESIAVNYDNNRNSIILNSYLHNTASRNSEVDLNKRTVQWNIGDKRYLNLEDGKGNFKKTEVQLYAKSRYCYVWCVPSEATSFSKLNGFADVFDAVCLPVIYLSGSPSKYIYGDYSGNSLVKVSENGFSPTGEMTNIVVYDIGNDSASGNCIGFFSSRDYYPCKESLQQISGKTYSVNDDSLNYSNEGQYLYMDSWYLRNKYGTALSTLVHEFHHLIMWGNKYMTNGHVLKDEWNEMLSMMCEDLLQEKISQEDTNFGKWDSPVQRLPYFEALYINSGLELRKEFNSVSYANLYAFGAWLLRNFGGKQLFSQMARNQYIDESMIVEAVNVINGTNYSMSNLVSMFAVSCVAKDYEYSMNKDALITSGFEGYNFPVTKIDLWNLKSAMPTFETNYTGCLYADSKISYNLRPYGMILSYLGKTGNNSFTVQFANGDVSVKQKLYIVISDNPPVQ